MRARNSSWLGIIAVAASCLTGVVANRADACVLIPPAPDDVSVAADGSLRFVYRCTPGVAPCTTGATPPAFQVLGPASEVVDGATTKSGIDAERGVWVVWTPTQPFVNGKTYQIVPSDQAAGPVPFTPLPVDAFDATLVKLAFKAELSSTGAGESVCCSPNPFVMHCGADMACFGKQRQEVVSLALTLVLDGNGLPVDTFQDLYRITFSADGQDTVLPDSTFPAVSFNSQQAAKEYCYSVDAIDPVTDVVTHVSDGCQTLNVASLALRAPTDAELRGNFASCSRPPVGYESDWLRVGQVSEGQMYPDASTNAPRDAGTPSADASITPDAGPMLIDRVIHDDGCSATGAVDGGYGLALLALMLRKRRRP